MYKQNRIKYLIFVMVLVSIFLILLTNNQDNIITGKATSQASMDICINNPPTLYFTCNSSFNQSTPEHPYNYTCQLTGVDDNTGQTITYNYSGNLTFTFNNITGYFNFTPEQDDVGLTNITFTLTDNSTCVNSESTTIITFNISNVNDFPIYNATIPDISFPRSGNYSGLYLSDYFSDVDGETLNYTINQSIDDVNITILNTSEVTITSDVCKSGEVIFRATDAAGAYDETSEITVTITCPSTGGEEVSSTGGGGGMSFASCIPQLICDDWSECSENGTQFRNCLDMANCTTTKLYWQDCEYFDHCYNNVQDEGETGVDCGGNCKDCIVPLQRDDTCRKRIKDYSEVQPIDGPCMVEEEVLEQFDKYTDTIRYCGEDCIYVYNYEISFIIPLETDSVWEQIIYILLILIVGSLTIYSIIKISFIKLLTLFKLTFFRKAYHQILLSKKQTNHFITQLNHLRNSISDYAESKEVSLNKFTQINRSFFNEIIHKGIDFEKTAHVVSLISISKDLEILLSKQHALTINLEKIYKIPRLNLEVNILLLQEIILAISVKEPHYISKEKLFKISEEISYLESNKALYNALLYINEKDFENAKKAYIVALDKYNKLDSFDQNEIYLPLKQTYVLIKNFFPK